MTATSATSNRFVKSTEPASGESLPRIGETSVRVINKIKEMYELPAVIFGRWLGISDKTAKRKLKFERALTTEELGILIRSERGFEVVAAIMGDATPGWWRLVVPLMDAADARKMQIAARRRLEKTIESAVDADKHLAAAISRAEALQDQDHVSIQLDALRSMARVHGGALASSRKGRGQ